VPEDTRTQGRTVIAWLNLRSDSNWNPDRSESEVGLPATTVRLSVNDIGPRSVKHDQCDCDKLLTLSVLSAHACEVTQYNHVYRRNRVTTNTGRDAVGHTGLQTINTVVSHHIYEYRCIMISNFTYSKKGHNIPVIIIHLSSALHNLRSRQCR